MVHRCWVANCEEFRRRWAAVLTSRVEDYVIAAAPAGERGVGAVAVRICSSLFTSAKEIPVLLADPRRLTVSVCVKWCTCSFVLLMDPTRAHMMSLRFLSGGGL